MNRYGVFLLVALPAFFAAPLLALPEPTDEEKKENEARLGQWKNAPEKIARLRRDLKAFLELPPERREQVAKLERDLRAEMYSTQSHLRDVLQRYADWLDRQSPQVREAIAKAPSKARRIEMIQELRDKEWLEKQPKAIKQQYAFLNPEEKPAFMRKLRQDESDRRKEWQLAARFWKELEGKQVVPARLADFDARDARDDMTVQVLVREYLWPMLSKEEKMRLEKAEGNWPAYPQALVEIADRHPFALPGLDGPRRLQELPVVLQARFINAKVKEPFELKKAHDLWPDFAIAVVDRNKTRQKFSALPRELWACNYKSLYEPMQRYVDNVLIPALTPEEKLRLEKANVEKLWPTYPLTIQELCDHYRLPPPPWQTALPGPRERWDIYRELDLSGMPEVPRHILHDFAMYELNPQDRAKLKLSATDPMSEKRLREEFWKCQEQELKLKLPQFDLKKLAQKPPPFIFMPPDKFRHERDH